MGTRVRPYSDAMRVTDGESTYLLMLRVGPKPGNVVVYPLRVDRKHWVAIADMWFACGCHVAVVLAGLVPLKYLKEWAASGHGFTEHAMAELVWHNNLEPLQEEEEDSA